MNGDVRTSIGTTICGRNSILAWRAKVFFRSFVLFSLTSNLSIKTRLQVLFSFLFLSLPSTMSWFCFVFVGLHTAALICARRTQRLEYRRLTA